MTRYPNTCALNDFHADTKDAYIDVDSSASADGIVFSIRKRSYRESSCRAHLKSDSKLKRTPRLQLRRIINFFLALLALKERARGHTSLIRGSVPPLGMAVSLGTSRRCNPRWAIPSSSACIFATGPIQWSAADAPFVARKLVPDR
jgi:hypothetical protein